MKKQKTKIIKTKSEIEIMKKSGLICAIALKKVIANVRVGITCSRLNDIAHREIKANGAKPSFMTVDDYKWTICTTVNDQVVHGIPTDRQLKEGDIIGIDIGALYQNYHSDLAITIPVSSIDQETKHFLDVGQLALVEALKKAKAGNRIGDISSVIQKIIESNGYSIVKNLTGHGVGRQLHEDPLVPGFGQQNTGDKLENNMTLAIEVIYTKGNGKVILDPDGWTISSQDHSLAGLFEQTVAISNNGPIVLTPYL